MGKTPKMVLRKVPRKKRAAKKESGPPAVCLLSAHPMVLEEYLGVLVASGLRTVAVRLEQAAAKPDPNPAIPPAKMYVMDLHGPTRASESLISHLRNTHPDSPVVLMAEAFPEEAAFPLLRLGARGLVRYNDARKQLPLALAAVRGGGYWVPRQLLSRFITSILDRAGGGQPVRAARLSPREQQVAEALLENLANKEIAARLGLTERTVKFHVSNVLAKHGVRRRADLILLSFHSGAVPRSS